MKTLDLKSLLLWVVDCGSVLVYYDIIMFIYLYNTTRFIEEREFLVLLRDV